MSPVGAQRQVRDQPRPDPRWSPGSGRRTLLAAGIGQAWTSAALADRADELPGGRPDLAALSAPGPLMPGYASHAVSGSFLMKAIGSAAKY